MYETFSSHEVRRCPVPQFPKVEEDDQEDAGAALGDQPEIGVQHRAGDSRAVTETPGGI